MDNKIHELKIVLKELKEQIHFSTNNIRQIQRNEKLSPEGLMTSNLICNENLNGIHLVNLILSEFCNQREELQAVSSDSFLRGIITSLSEFLCGVSKIHIIYNKKLMSNLPLYISVHDFEYAFYYLTSILIKHFTGEEGSDILISVKEKLSSDNSVVISISATGEKLDSQLIKILNPASNITNCFNMNEYNMFYVKNSIFSQNGSIKYSRTKRYNRFTINIQAGLPENLRQAKSYSFTPDTNLLRDIFTPVFENEMSEIIRFPKPVSFVLERLKHEGFDAYLVGGAVRDYYMGNTPNDFDITTSALPEEILEIFSDCKTIETGKKFGTITVIKDSLPMEITTFRTDGDYLNSRSPETVSFTRSLEEDLKRRDFTINALVSSSDNLITDLFSGTEDIENKIIRTIGNADDRFREDALRILRAIRFSSYLGFEIEKSTRKSIQKNKNLLKNISKERIRDEFSKILLGENVKNVLIEYREVFEVFIPELMEISVDRYIEIADEIFCAKAVLEIRFGIFLTLFDKKTGTKILKDLKFSTIAQKTVLFLSEYFEKDIENDKTAIKHLLNRFDAENVSLLFEMKNKDQKLLYEIINGGECFSLKDLALKGDDLLSLDIPEKEIGKLLKKALNEVISHPEKNNKEYLSEFVMKK